MRVSRSWLSAWVSRMLASRILILALLVIAAGCSQQKSTVSPAPPPEKPVIPPAIPERAEPSPEELAAARRQRLACEELTVAAVGDIMLGTDFPKNHLADDDAESMLRDVTPVLSGADITVGNLEGVLMDGGEPKKKCKDPDACYLFRSPSRYADRLADAGFDVMSLANNHARDFGEDGRSATMTALQDAGIMHSGRTGDVASWQAGDIRIAFIAFAPFTDSWPMLDQEGGRSQVRLLAENHDIVIVSFHGGAEGVDASHVPFATEYYYGEDRGNVVEFSRGMIDAGADLVLGHGPHVPRAMEIYRERLVAYSLGNFATYYGISVTGEKGYAPILLATLDGNGRFVSGDVVSAVQMRPAGPRIDNRHRAYEMMRALTQEDFDGDAIRFLDGGQFHPEEPRALQCGSRQSH